MYFRVFKKYCRIGMIRNVVLPIIVCSLLLIVQACSSGHEDEVEPVVEEKGFTVKVFYINEAQPDVEIPDAGAKVYLYYGVNNGELVRGEFQAGGPAPGSHLPEGEPPGGQVPSEERYAGLPPKMPGSLQKAGEGAAVHLGVRIREHSAALPCDLAPDRPGTAAGHLEAGQYPPRLLVRRGAIQALGGLSHQGDPADLPPEAGQRAEVESVQEPAEAPDHH